MLEDLYYFNRIDHVIRNGKEKEDFNGKIFDNTVDLVREESSITLYELYLTKEDLLKMLNMDLLLNLGILLLPSSALHRSQKES